MLSAVSAAAFDSTREADYENSPIISQSLGHDASTARSVGSGNSGKTFWIKDNVTNTFLKKNTNGALIAASYGNSYSQKWQFIFQSDGSILILNVDTENPDRVSALSLLDNGTVGTVEYNFNSVTNAMKWELSAFYAPLDLYYLKSKTGEIFLKNNSGIISTVTYYINATAWKLQNCSNKYTMDPEAQGYISKINNSNLLNYMNCYSYAIMTYYENDPLVCNESNSNCFYFDFYKLQMGDISQTNIDYSFVVEDSYIPQNSNYYLLTNRAILQYRNAVINAVENDLNVIFDTENNIIQKNNSDVATGAQWRKVALYITEKFETYSAFDYHWYVADSDNYWTHKPGIAPVRNVDESNVIISDLSDADTGKYDLLIGYFFIRCDSVLKKLTADFNSGLNNTFWLSNTSIDICDQGDILTSAKTAPYVVSTFLSETGSINNCTKDIWTIFEYNNNYD